MAATSGLARLRALGLGVLTSCIWASSFAIIKLGLRDAGPLTLGGLRYCAGFLFLAPLLARLPGGSRLPERRAGLWLGLAATGLLAYPIANGLLYPALGHLDVTAASFVFNQAPVFTLVLGAVALAERPSLPQLAGFGLLAAGLWLFFGSPGAGQDPMWLLVVAGSAAAFAAYSVWARRLAGAGVGTVVLAAWPLAIGGGVMLAIGLAVEGVPRPSWGLAVIVVWLAVVNTAVAYLAWARALRDLRAFEVSVLLGLTPMVTALVAWPLLGQPPTALRVLAMAVATAGIVVVQAAASRPRAAPS